MLSLASAGGYNILSIPELLLYSCSFIFCHFLNATTLCRPLSKTVRFNVLKVIPAGSSTGGKKAFTGI